MRLFNNLIDPQQNLLPYDGEVNDFGVVFDPESADQHFQQLLAEIDWQPDQARFYGKLITTKRKVAWHGDQPYEYTYSNVSKRALPWTEQLQHLKQLISEKTQATYNACLLNLYHNGDEGMAWHSDGEKDLVPGAAIASVSLGAERKFCFKHKASKETIAMLLAHGSLIVMRGSTQEHWLHRLPPTKKVSQPRINLTFRSMH